MNFGAGVREVVGVDFSQQHRAFDPLGLGQLGGFSFGELEQGSTYAARLRVTVAPAPVLNELPRPLHGFIFDQAGLDLRPRDQDSATFLLSPAPAPVFGGYETSRRLPILTITLIPRGAGPRGMTSIWNHEQGG